MPPPLTLSRRALLSGSAGTFALVTLALPGCAASPALDEDARATLALLARDLFPHPILSDAPYRAIVANAFPVDGDENALAGAAAAVVRLDTGKERWATRLPGARADALKPLMGEPFFLGFRFTVLAGLYGDLGVTRRFGYEGPSFEAGGYINRGFDALPWLPVPAGQEASRWPI